MLLKGVCRQSSHHSRPDRGPRASSQLTSSAPLSFHSRGRVEVTAEITLPVCHLAGTGIGALSVFPQMWPLPTDRDVCCGGSHTREGQSTAGHKAGAGDACGGLGHDASTKRAHATRSPHSVTWAADITTRSDLPSRLTLGDNLALSVPPNGAWRLRPERRGAVTPGADTRRPHGPHVAHALGSGARAVRTADRCDQQCPHTVSSTSRMSCRPACCGAQAGPQRIFRSDVVCVCCGQASA